MQKQIITLSNDEIAIIDAILLEVCYGIGIKDFTNMIGASEEDVEKLFEKIRSIYKGMESDKTTIVFNKNEMMIIYKALQSVHTELESWEFQTRTGHIKDKSILLLKKWMIFL